MSERAAATATFRFNGFALRIDGDDSRIVDAIGRRFAAAQTEVTAGLEQLHFVVRSVPTDLVPGVAPGGRLVYESPLGRAYWYDDGARLELESATGHAVCSPRSALAELTVARGAADALWVASRPLFTLTLAELLRYRGLYFLHAGAVQVDGGSLLLPGASGAGKSTLTTALALAGYPLLGDDSIFLGRRAESLRVWRFADEIDLGERSLDLLGLRSGPRRRRLSPVGKAQFAAEDLHLRVGSETTIPRFLVFPALRAGTAALQRLAPDEALLELLPNVLLADQAIIEEHVGVLADLATSTPAFRLFVPCDLGAAVDTVRRDLLGVA